MEGGLVRSIGKLIGKAHAVVAGTEWPVDGFDAVAFVNRALNYRHSRCAPRGDLIELAALRNLKLERAVFQVIRDGGMRLILNCVFFADQQAGTLRLQNDCARCDGEGMRVGGRFVDGDVCGGSSGSDWLVIEDAFVGHAEKHGAGTERVTCDCEMAG